MPVYPAAFAVSMNEFIFQSTLYIDGAMGFRVARKVRRIPSPAISIELVCRRLEWSWQLLKVNRRFKEARLQLRGLLLIWESLTPQTSDAWHQRQNAVNPRD